MAKGAQELVVKILSRGRPISMMGIVASAHHQQRCSPDEVRRATWNLVDSGTLVLTNDQRFKLKTSAELEPAEPHHPAHA